MKMDSTPVFMHFSVGLFKFLLRFLLLLYPKVRYLNPNHRCFVVLLKVPSSAVGP